MGAAGSIAGKSVLISGASHGLGEALAGEFTRRGARLTLLARTGDELEAVADRCRRTGGDAIAVAGDVTSGDDCRRAVDAAVDRHGGLDILIANAGLSMWAPFEQVESTDVLRRLMDVNYMGAVNPAMPDMMSVVENMRLEVKMPDLTEDQRALSQQL